MILFKKILVLDKPALHFARYLTGLRLWNEDISSDLKHRIETYWGDKLAQQPYDEKDSSKEKYYVLSMFPYPSGFLHMGHIRVYTISDTVARFQRMNGKNVIHPIGWDAFGLPAENAAMERQMDPSEWTYGNIAHMRTQLKQLGCSFDWDREIATCDPVYYHWTQDLFLKLYDAGLIYRKEALVNWDPVDKTVLADEQVDENGNSWRSGAKVEKKLLRQWFVKTTQLAKDLYDGLGDSMLEDWRDIVKLQKHWIGECDGINFDFSVCGNDGDTVTLWTDKPELIGHVKFVAVTSNHVLAKKEGVGKLSGTVRLKTLVRNSLISEQVPVFVTDEIEFLPFTDSYLGIPGACESDAIFAQNNNISFEPIITEEHKLKEIRESVCSQAQKLGVGGYRSSAKLRDWLISRQRYWGTPIPIIHCDNCGTVPVPRENLPVQLPKLTRLTQKGKSPLDEVHDWVNTSCPKCGGPAKRETDTMDTFVDSTWYFLRYLDPKNHTEMFDKDKIFKGMPVDLYIGGKEHAVLHLYYARFVAHFLYSLGFLPEREPFKRLLVQGMVMGRSYRLKGTGRYLTEDQVDVIDLKRNKAVVKDTGEPVVVSWEKMSKSKHNGVDPDDMFGQYGTDTTRLLILADVSPTSHRNWNTSTFPGILNWQNRLWLTMRDFLKYRSDTPPTIPPDELEKHEATLWDSRNFYIKGATFNYVISQQLSVAISKQQGLTNSLRKMPPAVFAGSLQFERALAAQILLLAPMAPHFASELWAGFISAPNRLIRTDEIAWDKTVLEQRWPEIDVDYQLDLSCQINGNEKCVLKFSKIELERMTKDQATELAVEQMSNSLSRRKVLGIEFRRHKNCDAILNVFTDPLRHVKQKVDLEN